MAWQLMPIEYRSGKAEAERPADRRRGPCTPRSIRRLGIWAGVCTRDKSGSTSLGSFSVIQH